MKARIFVLRSVTEVRVPRRMAWRSMIPNHTPINRPWGLLSSICRVRVAVGESVELPGEAVDDAGMTGDFGVSTAGFGVFAERGDVGELRL